MSYNKQLFKTDTNANLAASSAILSLGEPLFITDAPRRLIFGDQSSAAKNVKSILRPYFQFKPFFAPYSSGGTQNNSYYNTYTASSGGTWYSMTPDFWFNPYDYGFTQARMFIQVNITVAGSGSLFFQLSNFNEISTSFASTGTGGAQSGGSSYESLTTDWTNLTSTPAGYSIGALQYKATTSSVAFQMVAATIEFR